MRLSNITASLTLLFVALPSISMAAAASGPSLVTVAPDLPLSFNQLQAQGLFKLPTDTNRNTNTAQSYEVDFVSGNFRYRVAADYGASHGWQLKFLNAAYVRNEDVPPVTAVPRAQLFPDAGATMWPEAQPLAASELPPPPPPPPPPGIIPPPPDLGDFVGQTRAASMTGWQGWWNVSSAYTWVESTSGSRSWYLTSFNTTRCSNYQKC